MKCDNVCGQIGVCHCDALRDAALAALAERKKKQEHTLTKQFRPMLAATCDDIANLQYPVLASPKLDGIRAMVINGVLVSRNLKPIPNLHCQKLFARPWYEGYDGELIVGSPTGSGVWARSQSGVMRKSGEPEVTFHVFDRFGKGVGDDNYPTRLAKIAGAKDRLSNPHILLVDQTKITNAVDLNEYEAETVADGYEGVMVRRLAKTSPYKFGRSTLREGLLVKVIRKHTLEGVVVGMVEQMHNGNAATKDALGRTKRSKVKAGLVGKGTLGALVLTRPGDGSEPIITTFEVGTGFDDKTRAELWAKGAKLNGRVVKVEYRELTPDGLPRFPVYLGLRDTRDMDNTTSNRRA